MRITRHRSASLLLCALLAPLQLARAEIAAPNAAGVAMGHLHYHVADVAASRDFWVALGGTPDRLGEDVLVRFPGFVVVLSDAATAEQPAAADTPASLVDHVAFRIQSFDAIEAAGFAPEYNAQFPGIGILYSPDGAKVEFFEEGVATNAGFDIDPGYEDDVAGRHNRPITGPIVSHHLHFNVPDAEVAAARDWYVTHFGATPGMRWRYLAADLPGMNLNFSAAPAARGPTTGGTPDHIGFEIDDLEAFCAALESAGVALDVPYRRTASGLAVAVLTDPWGTRIELTEGLRQ